MRSAPPPPRAQPTTAVPRSSFAAAVAGAGAPPGRGIRGDARCLAGRSESTAECSANRFAPVLMIAEKFPPHATRGATRPFFFARYLCDFGYRPIVLTSPLLRGDRSDPDLLRALPADVEVVRAFRSVAAARLAFPQRPYARRDQGRTRSAEESATSRAVTRSHRLASGGGGPRPPSGWQTGIWIGCRPRSRAAPPWAPAGSADDLGHGAAHEESRPGLCALSGTQSTVGRRSARPMDLRQPLAADFAADGEDRATLGAKVLGAASLIVFTSPLTQREMEARFPGCAASAGRSPTGIPRKKRQSSRCEGIRGQVPLASHWDLKHQRTPDVLLRALQVAIERKPSLRSTLHLEFVGDLGGTRQGSSTAAWRPASRRVDTSREPKAWR